MKILGAGLAGCLAGIAFPDAEIKEMLDTPSIHKAILRFRSDAVSRFTGIPFKKVTVHKGIFSNGKFVDCNIRIANSYSDKVTGFINDRSIWNTKSCERWIAPEDFHQQIYDMCSGRIQLGYNEPLNDDVAISTLPLSVLAAELGLEERAPICYANPIYVTTVKIEDCDVYQTIYYPDNRTDVYRASLESGKLIIESIAPILNREISAVLDSFAIRRYEIMEMSYKQCFGKIVYPNVEEVKEFIYDLTDNHNIYSLGRSALLKDILLDDTLQDIKRIKEMMVKTDYQKRLG